MREQMREQSKEESRKSLIAGWSSPVARQAHNLKVVGSNPTPATKYKKIRYRKRPQPLASPAGAGHGRMKVQWQAEMSSMCIFCSVLYDLSHGPVRISLSAQEYPHS